MDPLLNFGVLWRCLAAYCGISFQTETENFRQMLIESNNNGMQSPTSIASGTPSSSSKKNAFRFPYKSGQQHLSVDSSMPSPSDDPSQTNGCSKPVLKSSASIDDSSASLNLLPDPEWDRIKRLHAIMGDSIFLVEVLRNHSLPNDPFISPLLSEDWILAKFPRTCIIVSIHFLNNNNKKALNLIHAEKEDAKKKHFF